MGTANGKAEALPDRFFQSLTRLCNLGVFFFFVLFLFLVFCPLFFFFFGYLPGCTGPGPAGPRQPAGSQTLSPALLRPCQHQPLLPVGQKRLRVQGNSLGTLACDLAGEAKAKCEMTSVGRLALS